MRFVLSLLISFLSLTLINCSTINTIISVTGTGEDEDPTGREIDRNLYNRDNYGIKLIIYSDSTKVKIGNL